MKQVKIVYFVLITLLLGSLCACEKTDNLTLSERLIGTWGEPQAQDTASIVYTRINKLGAEYGISFQEGYTLVERKNAGWCGTPPISYADFVGTWSMTDSVLSINVGFWGGTVDLEWKIIDITDKKLTIRRLSETTHMEE